MCTFIVSIKYNVIYLIIRKHVGFVICVCVHRYNIIIIFCYKFSNSRKKKVKLVIVQVFD